MLFAVLIVFSAVCYYGYSFLSALLILKRFHRESWPLGNTLWFWCKWPALTYIIAMPVASILTDSFSGWDVAACAISLLVWWLGRNAGDDDEHKKYKKKLKNKITQLNGRLVVVPEPA